MKKAKKILTLVACAVLLVCISVGATLAYLTAVTSQVTNTFTVGNVTLDDPTTDLNDGLDEAKVDVYGKEVEGVERVLDNEYKLMPGHTYTKDPTVHVQPGSEPCYVYVRVVNEIAAIEIKDNLETEDIDESKGLTIEDQLVANNWVKHPNYDNIYYYDTDITDDVVGTVVDTLGETTVTDLVVFESFTIDSDTDIDELKNYANHTEMVPKVDDDGNVVKEDGKTVYEPKTYTTKKITIMAYALQKDGFSDAVSAYNTAPCSWGE